MGSGNRRSRCPGPDDGVRVVDTEDSSSERGAGDHAGERQDKRGTGR